MTSTDIVIILVMTFPMFLFSIYPGIKVSEYMQDRYNVTEKQKRTIMVSVTFLFALTLSILLYVL